MRLIDKLKRLRHKIYIWRFCHSSIQKNKIIMWADSFKHFGCSPKYIALYLLKHYPGRFDLVWVFEDGAALPPDFPDAIRCVRYFSINYLRELHTAKFVICNMRTGPAQYWKKRPDQIYIQTGHSSLRLKKIEGDAAEHFDPGYIKICQEDSDRIDLLLSGCRFSSDIFKRAFWYDGEILESGTPRCDILLDGDCDARKKVFDTYGIDTSQKLLLYAPTFRSNKPSDFLGMDFHRLKASLGENWVIGARLHPNVLATVIPDEAISMSKYSDMQELIAAADILITDFSSCMFDMAIAGKPCVLYAPDLQEYIERERGLYFDIRELPFPIAQSMDELCDIIENSDEAHYHERRRKFMTTIGSFEDGHAAERVCQYICQQQ